MLVDEKIANLITCRHTGPRLYFDRCFFFTGFLGSNYQLIVMGVSAVAFIGAVGALIYFGLALYIPNFLIFDCSDAAACSCAVLVNERYFKSRAYTYMR